MFNVMLVMNFFDRFANEWCSLVVGRYTAKMPLFTLSFVIVNHFNWVVDWIFLYFFTFL